MGWMTLEQAKAEGKSWARVDDQWGSQIKLSTRIMRDMGLTMAGKKTVTCLVDLETGRMALAPPMPDGSSSLKCNAGRICGLTGKVYNLLGIKSPFKTGDYLVAHKEDGLWIINLREPDLCTREEAITLYGMRPSGRRTRHDDEVPLADESA